jgi:predicted RNase H-like HicB family nuclease
MATHEEILATVWRIAGARRDWTFTPNEIVRALPHLHPGTVRTHITSRCCSNAPKNHPHKWDYFVRVERGRYQLAPKYRRAGRGASVARETSPAYAPPSGAAPRHTIHAAVTHGDDWFTAECLELSVVTQGRTLDETVANLREAIQLHLEGEDPALFALAYPLELHVTFDVRVS